MTTEKQEKTTPWKNGNYKSRATPSYTYFVDGESVVMQDAAARSGQVKTVEDMYKGTFTYGEFGEAHPEVAEETGRATNDLQIVLFDGQVTVGAVLDSEGTKITFWSYAGLGLDVLEWMTEEEYEEMKQFGEPAEAPSSHYNIQPDNVGKLVFITGPPGLGKSTTGHMLSKKAGYVYYEGDCFDQGVNPFIPPDATEPSLATVQQKPLLGMPQERIDATKAGSEDFNAMLQGKEHRMEVIGKYYAVMCKDIDTQRKRIGGDWVVVHAVPSRYFRDVIRAELGPDLIFVVLNMSKEGQRERLIARQGEENEGLNDLLASMFDLYEPATNEEENAIDLVITNQMTREEVLEQLLKEIQ